MGFRDNWMNHIGAISVHNEATLHAYDREIPPRPLAMLLVGIGNGGDVEVWQASLPQGSSVTAMDSDPACQQIPDVVVEACDVTQPDQVRSCLRGRWFDVVIDRTGTMQPYVWPFLRAGGVYIYEGYNVDMVMMLVRDVATDNASWLPIEEIMRVDVYESCVVLEKRNPKVVPYLEVVTGNFAEVTPESMYYGRGAKRVLQA